MLCFDVEQPDGFVDSAERAGHVAGSRTGATGNFDGGCPSLTPGARSRCTPMTHSPDPETPTHRIISAPHRHK